jgi:hypothetical protein
MKEKPNLGRVINVPGSSDLWVAISEIVFQHMLNHFLTFVPEWKENAINQLERLLINEEEVSWVEWSKLDELSSFDRLLQELDACLDSLDQDIYGSYDYASFENAHKHLHSMEWSDVDGESVDKYDYWNAVYAVMGDSVVPAVQEWMKEVQASDPKWTHGEEGFKYPVFTWDEEKQQTTIATAMWFSPFVSL